MTLLLWMAAAAALAALFALGGALVEPLTARGAPRRRLVWGASILAALVLPLVLALPAAMPTAASAAAPALGPAAAPAITSGMVLTAWAILSLAVAALLGSMQLGLVRAAKRWERRELFGRTVLVSPDFGPAVLGFVRPRSVVPAWVLDLPEEDRRLIVAHESYHVVAHDQWLLLLGLGAAVLMPWSPALWYALRRLRDAIELDCDWHVARPAGVERYCRVLLEARQHTHSRLRVSLAFARPALTTRVEALLEPRRLGGTAVALRTGAAACSLAAVFLIPVPRLTAPNHAAPPSVSLRQIPGTEAPAPTVTTPLPASPTRAAIAERPRARPRRAAAPVAPAAAIESVTVPAPAVMRVDSPPAAPVAGFMRRSDDTTSRRRGAVMMRQVPPPTPDSTSQRP